MANDMGNAPGLSANPAAAEIGYYAPAMGIPERARLNLRGHARPPEIPGIGRWMISG